jgi:hypothetical protein
LPVGFSGQEGSIPIVVSTPLRPLRIPVAVISLTSLLILQRDRSGRVALAIEVGAVPARNRVAAAAIRALVLPCGLILRRKIAVRIAAAVARAEIPAMAAWRRMGGTRYCTVCGDVRFHIGDVCVSSGRPARTLKTKKPPGSGLKFGSDVRERITRIGCTHCLY